MSKEEPLTLRIDKWLWHARFFKSRTLAGKFVNSGKVRVNGTQLTKANYTLKEGEVLTFAKGPYVRLIKVLHMGSRRGPAPEAQTLYEDMDPPQPRIKTDKPPSVAEREPGSGRPTKRERRVMDQWLDEAE